MQDPNGISDEDLDTGAKQKVQAASKQQQSQEYTKEITWGISITTETKTEIKTKTIDTMMGRGNQGTERAEGMRQRCKKDSRMRGSKLQRQLTTKIQ